MVIRLMLAILIGVLLAWPLYRLLTCRCWRRLFYRRNLQCLTPYQPRQSSTTHDGG
ncbi:MAG: hypothetical protein H6R04_614 [Burkholderiaceae bacterium]|nr:hypothetical protein [Burkholderiaceae bacterium]